VYFGLEDGDEAGFAELRVIFGAENQRAIRVAERAGRGCHICVDGNDECGSVAGRFW
jgi:hypothetical protein